MFTAALCIWFGNLGVLIRLCIDFEEYFLEKLEEVSFIFLLLLLNLDQ